MSDHFFPEPDLAERLIGDAAAHVALPREPLAARVATALRAAGDVNGPHGGEEIAQEIFDRQFSDDELERLYTDALERVRADYLRHADGISAVIGDLVERGRGSWIAGALGHRIVFDGTWEAFDQLGELHELPDLVCRKCGAVVEI